MKKKKRIIISVGICVILLFLLLVTGSWFNKETYSDTSGAPILCPPGQYLPSSSNKCATCLEGYYCIGGSHTFSMNLDQGINKCPDGYTSNSGADESRDCYQDETSQSVDDPQSESPQNGCTVSITEKNGKINVEQDEYVSLVANINNKGDRKINEAIWTDTLTSKQLFKGNISTYGYYAYNVGKSSIKVKITLDDGSSCESGVYSLTVTSKKEFECTTTNECETHKHNCEENHGLFYLNGDNSGSCDCANGYVNSAADEYTCIKQETGKKYPTITVKEPNNMLVGDTFDISPSAKYNNTNVEGTYKYEGYDSNIVTVSTNGVITAKKVGETTIKLTFSSKNTSEYINTITKYVKVKVVECNGINDPSDKDADGYGWADSKIAIEKGYEECSKSGKSALYHDWGGDGCYNYYCRETGGNNGGNNENNNTNNSGNANNNPTTGSTFIYVVWFVGTIMIGYAIWYFKQNTSSSN